jgi:hypothetical protein
MLSNITHEQIFSSKKPEDSASILAEDSNPIDCSEKFCALGDSQHNSEGKNDQKKAGPKCKNSDRKRWKTMKQTLNPDENDWTNFLYGQESHIQLLSVNFNQNLGTKAASYRQNINDFITDNSASKSPGENAFGH